MQHGLTALFSSFVFQWGRLRPVTCQRCLYYFGEAQGKKKKVPWGVSISVTVAVWSLQPKNVEISVFFSYRYFPYFVYSDLSFRQQHPVLRGQGPRPGTRFWFVGRNFTKYLVLLSLQNPPPHAYKSGIGVNTASERCSQELLLHAEATVTNTILLFPSILRCQGKFSSVFLRRGQQTALNYW